MTVTALVPTEMNSLAPWGEKKERRSQKKTKQTTKKKGQICFDLKCSLFHLCKFASTPLQLPFPFSAPLAPSMHLNHHL